MREAYSTSEAATFLQIDESRLRYWAQTGFVNPSGRHKGRPAYTFADLIALRTAKGLTEAGISLQHVRRCLDKLRQLLPSAKQPLSELRIWSDGAGLVVQADDKPFEPLSGQAVLDFSTASLSTSVQALADTPIVRSGYSHFLEGCRLEDAGRDHEAESAFLRAAQADPTLACSWTNLGKAYYRRGAVREAKEAFLRAIELDPEQPEGRYNLATLLDEQGDIELAIAEYRRVLRHHPDFADAHFNLAKALEQVGGQTQAREHFERFLSAYSGKNDAWTETARSELARGAVPTTP